MFNLVISNGTRKRSECSMGIKMNDLLYTGGMLKAIWRTPSVKSKTDNTFIRGMNVGVFLVVT